MAHQLWLSGVIMAFLSFGIKTGIGIVSRLLNSGSRKSKLLFVLGSLMIYAILFAALHLVVTRLNLVAYLDRIMELIRFGMLIHIAIAAGLLLWGLKLLLLKDEQCHSNGAGLFLMLPCPVCMTVILLNLTLARSLSPMPPLATTLTLLALFAAIVSITAITVILVTRKGRTNGRNGGKIDNSFLGGAMLLIALYFLGSILLGPLYPEIKAAYAMASSNNTLQQIDLRATATLAGAFAALAALGFARFQLCKKNFRNSKNN